MPRFPSLQPSQLINPLMWLFLGLLAVIVYSFGEFACAEDKKSRSTEVPNPPEVIRDLSALPERVREMRLAILRAASSGDLEEIRYVLEKNEIMPVLAREKVDDPVAYLKSESADGGGAEIMAIMIKVLTTGFVKVAHPDNEMYVWPHFAERGLKKMTPEELVELYRLAPPERVKAMREKGVYDYYRLEIGRDGTWHLFYQEG